MTATAFPDNHFTLEDMVAEGDKVVWRYSATGTHKGDFMGIVASGKHVTTSGIVISRVVNGKLQEDWECADELGLMQQLGVVPQTWIGK
jgi:predicted ester cyclase